MSNKILDSDLNVANKPQVNSGFTKRLSLRIGKITAVYTDKNTVDITWIFPNKGAISNLELTKPYVGLKSGINFIPQVGSVVTVGFAEDVPILLTYFLPSSFSNMLLGVKDNNGVPMRIRKLNEGEMSLLSSEQAEIYLSKKIEISDIGNDKIIVNPADGSISLDSLQLYIENEAGKITMGMVKRDGKIITDDGQSVTSLTGGNALTEYKLTINSLADNTINNTNTVNKAIAEITVGTLVDDSGNILYNQKGNKIVCNIAFSSGALIQVDEKGLINMNEGNMIKPTDSSTRSSAASKGVNDTTSPTDTQQRAAREGDRVTIPITIGQMDKDHLQLNQKAITNITSMSQLAPMIMVYGIPAVFVPTSPNVKLVGEITQGSDSVFIGSLDKTAEKQETSQNQ